MQTLLEKLQIDCASAAEHYIAVHDTESLFNGGKALKNLRQAVEAVKREREALAKAEKEITLAQEQT